MEERKVRKERSGKRAAGKFHAIKGSRYRGLLSAFGIFKPPGHMHTSFAAPRNPFIIEPSQLSESLELICSPAVNRAARV